MLLFVIELFSYICKRKIHYVNKYYFLTLKNREMRVRNLTFVALMAAASAVMAQEGNGYQFTDIVSNKATSVKNQAATGT